MGEINEQLQIKLAVDIDELSPIVEFESLTKPFKEVNEKIQSLNYTNKLLNDVTLLPVDVLAGDKINLEEYKPLLFNEDQPVFVARDETADLLREHLQEQRKQTELLEAIKGNTNEIYDLADILKANRDKQDEILTLIAEIKAISDAPADERESLVSRVHEKIQALQTAQETAQFLYGLVQTAQSFF